MPDMKGVLQYFSVECASTATESITNAVNGLGEKKRKIERIWFSPLWASSPLNTLYAIAKVQQTEVLKFDISHFMDLDSDTDQFLAIDRSLSMDLTLDRGEAFNVGFRKSGSNVGGTVSFAYRDLE